MLNIDSIDNIYKSTFTPYHTIFKSMWCIHVPAISRTRPIHISGNIGISYSFSKDFRLLKIEAHVPNSAWAKLFQATMRMLMSTRDGAYYITKHTPVYLIIIKKFINCVISLFIVFMTTAIINPIPLKIPICFYTYKQSNPIFSKKEIRYSF